MMREIMRDELDDMVATVLRELAAPAPIGAASSAPIHASIGIVEVHPSERRTADEILRDADLAMYQAKRTRRSHVG